MAVATSVWSAQSTESYLVTVTQSDVENGQTVTQSYVENGQTVTQSYLKNGQTREPALSNLIIGGCFLLKEDFDPQNNPHNLISKETEFYLSTFTSAGLIPLLFLLGVPGNILSAAVFYAQGLKERINLCVFSLALADLLVITVTFFLSIEQVYRSLVGPFSFFIENFVGFTGFLWVSMFLSAVISSERCFCVVSPLKAQQVLRTRTMCIFIIVVSFIILAGMLVIAGHKHTMACVFDLDTNTTSDILYVTQFYQDNKQILDILDVFLYATALPFIILVIIVVTTSITAIKLRSAAKWRQESASANQAAPAVDQKESRQVALTKMLIATSVLFVVCLTPMLTAQIAFFSVPELKYGGHYHNLTAALWSIISVFRCINSSLNFFVYYYMGSRFRYTLWHLLRCKKVKVSMGSMKQVLAKTSSVNSIQVPEVNSRL